MSFLTTNYEELNDNSYDALPTGEYEMIINKAYEDATPSGAENLTIDLIVRNDLKQVNGLEETNGKYANRHVFNANWKRKTTQQYDLENFQHILAAVGVPAGTAVQSVDHFCQLLNGKPVRVYVKKEVDDYNTTDESNPVYRNAVAPWNYSKSQFPNSNHQFPDGKAPQPLTADENPFKEKDVTDIPEEDYPF